MKTITSLSEFLTPQEIRLCKKLGDSAQLIRAQVIEPNIATINQKLGQENDPMYLSYLVLYLIG